MQKPIEHSENKITMQSCLFENEIGLEVLQLSVEQISILQKYEGKKLRPVGEFLILPLLFGILAGHTFSECWTGALQVKPRFKML